MTAAAARPASAVAQFGPRNADRQALVTMNAAGGYRLPGQLGALGQGAVVAFHLRVPLGQHRVEQIKRQPAQGGVQLRDLSVQADVAAVVVGLEAEGQEEANRSATSGLRKVARPALYGTSPWLKPPDRASGLFGPNGSVTSTVLTSSRSGKTKRGVNAVRHRSG